MKIIKKFLFFLKNEKYFLLYYFIKKTRNCKGKRVKHTVACIGILNPLRRLVLFEIGREIELTVYLIILNIEFIIYIKHVIEECEEEQYTCCCSDCDNLIFCNDLRCNNDCIEEKK